LNVFQSVLVRYPLTEAVAAASVACFPLNVDQSVLVRYPLTEAVADGMLTVTAPDTVDADTGAVPLTLAIFPLKVDQSVLVR
jgi:hypothetical protein